MCNKIAQNALGPGTPPIHILVLYELTAKTVKTLLTYKKCGFAGPGFKL